MTKRRKNRSTTQRTAGRCSSPFKASASCRDWFADAVADRLQEQWANDRPSPKCFDYGDTRAEALFQFIAETADPATTEDVRTHILECARCRFIYTNAYEAGAASTAPMSRRIYQSHQPHKGDIPELLRANLRTVGPVVFPGGQLADGAWEFGRLRNLPELIAEEISEVIVEQAWQCLRSLLPRQHIVVVCFSQPMHKCGKRLAAKLDAAGVDDVHVVMADNFFAPKLWCNPKELHGRHVIVLVDVVHTGGLLRRLTELCRRAHPEDIVGVAVIDQSRATPDPDIPLLALWQEEPEQRASYDGRRDHEVRFFDPAAALSLPREDLPLEVSDPEHARVTIEGHLESIAPILPYIEATGALKQDVQIGGVSYPWAVDLLCLLRDERARTELASRAVASLAPLASQGVWCLVYHAARHQRAGAWAELIGSILRWPVVKVGQKSSDHYSPLSALQQRALAKWPRALVVDAAIRTGKTLHSLVAVLRRAKLPAVRHIASFYAFDGLFDAQRSDLEESLAVQIHSLFRLPLGAPTEPVGRYCRQRIKDTLDELDDARSREHALWADPVRAYCRKKLVRVGRPSKRTTTSDTIRSLRHAIDEGHRGAEARLEQACDPPRTSLVTHLDVMYALREPRTRNVLHGFLCNSMPPDFIEWCALALATQDDYEWLDRDWLVLHKWLFTDSLSSRWLFLACVTHWLRCQGTPEQRRRVQRALHDFRWSQVENEPTLFSDLSDGVLPDPLSARCQALLSVLSRP